MERGGRTLQTLPAFDDPDVAAVALPALRRLIGEGRDRELVVGQGRRPADRRVAPSRSAPRGWLHRRLPRPCPPGPLSASGASAMPEGDTLRRIAAGLRPFLVGQGRDGGAGAGAGPEGRQGHWGDDHGGPRGRQEPPHPLRQRPRARTHLRMLGTWHRYRPGEPGAGRRLGRSWSWRSRAPSPSASTPRSSSSSRRGRRHSTRPSAARAGPPRPDVRWPPRPGAGYRRRNGRLPRSAVALLDQRALAGDRQRLQERGPLHRAGRSLRTGGRPRRRDSLDQLVETARRLLVENTTRARRGPNELRPATRRPARGSPGRPLGLGRAARPCYRCGTLIRSVSQGTDLPRTTYWCPGCQAPRFESCARTGNMARSTPLEANVAFQMPKRFDCWSLGP